MPSIELRIALSQSRLDRMWLDVEGKFDLLHEAAFVDTEEITSLHLPMLQAAAVLVLAEIATRKAARIADDTN